jgi:hypothetical protein
MLGKLGRELPLRQRLMNVPRVTTVFIKYTPDGWVSGWPTALLTPCPAGWVAARLGSSRGSHSSSAGLVLRSSSGGLHWSSAGLLLSSWELRWAACRLLLLLLGWCSRLGLSRGCLWLGCRLDSGRLLLIFSWLMAGQFRELLLCESSPGGCSWRRLAVWWPASLERPRIGRGQRVLRMRALPPVLH